MFGSLFIGCYTMKRLLMDTNLKEKFTTMHNLSQSSKVTGGMTPDEVRYIMGDEPILTELDRNVEEWHYCRSDDFPPKDRFLAIYFVDNKVIAKNFYSREKGIKVEVYGSCEHFAKTGDYKVPPEIQAILENNTPASTELKEPNEPIEPEKGVMPTVPDVKIPVQPTPPKTEEDE